MLAEIKKAGKNLIGDRSPTEERTIRKLGIDQIRLTDRIQPRETLDEETIEQYVTQMQLGASFPEVMVFEHEQHYWLADGFHRVEAAKRCGLTDIDADIRQGTQDDAEFFAWSANARHGLPLRNADKNRVAERMLYARHHGRLKNPDGDPWSDRQIARHIGVSQPFVSGVRERLFGAADKPRDHDRRSSGENPDGPPEAITRTAHHPDDGFQLKNSTEHDNGYHPSEGTGTEAAIQSQKTGATDHSIDDITEALIAHVMTYVQEHVDVSKAVLLAALGAALPVIEEQIQRIHAEGGS